MNFGLALQYLKEGYKVSRAGWNGKGLWVRMVESATFGNKIKVDGFFVIKNVQDTFNTWVPSISDLLAEDWGIVE